MITNDILTRLRNGEDAADIAEELINALNDANDVYSKEQEAKKAEAEAKAKREANKIKDMQGILDLLHDFCIDYYCDSDEDMNAVKEAFDELTAEKVIAMVEEAGVAILDMEKKIKQMEKMFGKFNAAPAKNRIPSKNTDAVINNFLRSIGL